MAHATQLTIGTGSQVNINGYSQEVSIELTYDLESADTDLMQTVHEKAEELALAHRATWQQIRDTKVIEYRRQSISVQEAQQPITQASDSAVIVESTALTEPATTGQQATLYALLSQAGLSEEDIGECLQQKFSCSGIEELNQAQASQWLLELQRSEREKLKKQRLTIAGSNGKVA